MTDPVGRRPGFESGAPLAISQVDPTTWDTVARLAYLDRDGNLWDVPIGSRTDLGSTPSPLDCIVSRTYGAPAYVLHDTFYRYWIKLGMATYRQADRILREALADLGVPRPTCWLAWAGVRWASILTRRGGAKGALRDLPALVAVTVPGLILAAPAAALLPSMAVLWAANRVAQLLVPDRQLTPVVHQPSSTEERS